MLGGQIGGEIFRSELHEILKVKQVKFERVTNVTLVQMLHHQSGGKQTEHYNVSMSFICGKIHKNMANTVTQIVFKYKRVTGSSG